MELLDLTKSLAILLIQDGLLVTLLLAIAGFACAVLLGAVTGITRFFRVAVLSQLFGLYVSCMRGLPFLMILFFLYYVMPFLGLRMSAITTAILALALHTGAYISEIVRGALTAIPKVQHEASRALAMTTWQRMRYVIMPQAMQLTLPPLAGQAVLHIKDTSVVSIIALIELTRVARVQMQSNMEPLLTFAVLSVFYIILCYPVLRLSAFLQRRLLQKAH